MMKAICIVAALYCLTVLCSCQKDVNSSNTPPITDSGTINGNYMPLTSGTYWIYKDSGFSDTYDTTTVLDTDTTINNMTFKKVHIVSAVDDSYGYYAIDNHNYYFNVTQSGINVTMLVLNDTASVGNSWVYDMGTINSIPARGTGTIVEKLDTYSVQGQTYSDVIHSQYVIAYNLLGTYTNFATYDFYFAKGKGIVRIKSVVLDLLGTGSNVESTQELVDYSIK